MKGSILVVGGQNVDICGRPHHPPKKGDSAPGNVRFSRGGVGRNIACNLALLGEHVRFLTAFGDDYYARQFQEEYRRLNIDTAPSLHCEGLGSSFYLYLTDETGEMELAVADMEIYRQLTPMALSQRLDAIQGAALCAADTNLPAESLFWLGAHCPAPLFVDGVSTAKVLRLRGMLHHIHTLKLNRMEGAALTGQPESNPSAIASALLEQGVSQVFLSLSAEGLYCANRDESYLLPIRPAAGTHTTGAGDTLMAALIWGWMQGFDLMTMGNAGLCAAALCMESPQSVNEKITAEAVLDKIKEAR